MRPTKDDRDVVVVTGVDECCRGEDDGDLAIQSVFDSKSSKYLQRKSTMIFASRIGIVPLYSFSDVTAAAMACGSGVSSFVKVTKSAFNSSI